MMMKIISTKSLSNLAMMITMHTLSYSQMGFQNELTTEMMELQMNFILMELMLKLKKKKKMMIMEKMKKCSFDFWVKLKVILLEAVIVTMKKKKKKKIMQKIKIIIMVIMMMKMTIYFIAMIMMMIIYFANTGMEKQELFPQACN